jgi:hypothetical protein
MTVLRIAFIVLVSLIFGVSPSFSQEKLREDVSKVFKQVYDNQLISADSSISRFERENPNHPVWSLLRANLVWWQILSGGIKDDLLKKQFIFYLNDSKSKAKEFLEDENEAAFSLIIVNAFRTRFDMFDNNYLTAASYLNACIDDISDSFGREEEYEPFYLTSGLYYYFMFKAYEDYPLIRPYLLFFPDGDKEKGMKYLLRCTESEDIFIREEATYFLMRISFDLDNDPKSSLKYAKSLLNRYPNNLIFRLFEINVLRQLNEIDAARRSESLFKKSLDLNTEFSSDQKTYYLSLLENDAMK